MKYRKGNKMSKKSHLSLIVLKSEKSWLSYLKKIFYCFYTKEKIADEENLIYTTDVLEMKILRIKNVNFF